MDRIAEIKKEIESIDTIDDSNIIRLESLCEEILALNKEDQHTSMLMEPLFRILERNPEYDFGMPGLIVHTLETYYRKGLEEELPKSLNRKPTFYTIWMLNRILNGTSDPKGQERYLEILKAILRMDVPDYLTEQVQHLIALHA